MPLIAGLLSGFMGTITSVGGPPMAMVYQNMPGPKVRAGFMLIPISAGSALGGRALLYYLVPYAAMSIGAFAVVAARERELGVPVTLENLAGFGWERPFLGFIGNNQRQIVLRDRIQLASLDQHG